MKRNLKIILIGGLTGGGLGVGAITSLVSLVISHLNNVRKASSSFGRIEDRV